MKTRDKPRIIFLLFTAVIFSTAEAHAFSPDSTIAPASRKYDYPNVIQRVILGENYRDAWSVPVKMPVFNLKEEHGGFNILELGGGKQTKSLKLLDRDSIEWALRTVDKNAEGTLPMFLRKTPVMDITQQMISTAYPYAPLTITALSRETGVTAPAPKLFFIPDDPALGEYRQIFANQVCFLERRYPTRDGKEGLAMDDVLKELNKYGYTVLQEEVLRARLLDILLADWDRHAGQWRWGTVDSGGKRYYYPVPVDRDQAYFYSNGLLKKAARWTVAPFMKGFKGSINGVKELSAKSRKFDRVFLNELNRKDWERVIKDVQANLSDAAIDRAIKQLPPEVYAIDGCILAQKLKSRRDDLYVEGMQYYSFLSKQIYLIASDTPEVIRIFKNNTMLTVAMYACNEIHGKCKIYERSFPTAETNIIYLIGLKENDRVELDKMDSKIKIRKIPARNTYEYDFRQQMLVRLESEK